MRWAKREADDPDVEAFTNENAKGGGELLFGRVTYEMMAAFWTTEMAKRSMPVVAEQMNALPKVVFSRTLKTPAWQNTRVVDELVESVRAMKAKAGPDMAVLGSGDVVRQLAAARLIDEYQVVVNPIVLGAGRTLFEGVSQDLRLVRSRVFASGKVFLAYAPR